MEGDLKRLDFYGRLLVYLSPPQVFPSSPAHRRAAAHTMPRNAKTWHPWRGAHPALSIGLVALASVALVAVAVAVAAHSDLLCVNRFEPWHMSVTVQFSSFSLFLLSPGSRRFNLTLVHLRRGSATVLYFVPSCCHA